MEILRLQANSVLKTKFNKLPSFPSATEIINFGDHCQVNIFQNSGNSPKVTPAALQQHTGVSNHFHP